MTKKISILLVCVFIVVGGAHLLLTEWAEMNEPTIIHQRVIQKLHQKIKDAQLKQIQEVVDQYKKIKSTRDRKELLRFLGSQNYSVNLSTPQLMSEANNCPDFSSVDVSTKLDAVNTGWISLRRDFFNFTQEKVRYEFDGSEYVREKRVRNDGINLLKFLFFHTVEYENIDYSDFPEIMITKSDGSKNCKLHFVLSLPAAPRK